MKKYIIILLVAVILSGCGTMDETPTALPTITISPTMLPTPTLTATVKPPPTLTPTPLPTLSPEQAEDFVRELVKTNGNCELPCWWGIAPGSNWDRTLDYLNTFSLETLEFPKENKNVVYWMSFPYPDIISTGRLTANFYVHDNIIEFIRAPGLGIGGRIIDTLTSYGPPTEVWINFLGEWPGGYTDYTIALDYPDKGMTFVFGGKGGDVNHNGRKFLTMCAGDLGIVPEVWLFSPGSLISFSDLTSKRFPGSFGFGELEQVTNLSDETFFDLFSTDPEACFETPYDLWPIYPTTVPP